MTFVVPLFHLSMFVLYICPLAVCTFCLYVHCCIFVCTFVHCVCLDLVHMFTLLVHFCHLLMFFQLSTRCVDMLSMTGSLVHLFGYICPLDV